MAVYKVPQDVEADDTLIGPFSLRQFIYLIIVAISIALAWAMSRIFIGLVILPLPLIVFFGALAWPFRKDQPMEIYLAAMMKFFLKPRMRPWKPEGQVNLVTIVAPKVEEEAPISRMTQTEAQERLEYLANVIDTQGWAARGVTDTAMLSLNDTVTAEASMVDDVQDGTVGIARQFDSLIEEQDAIRYRQAQQQFQQGLKASVAPVATIATPPSDTYAIPPIAAPQQMAQPVAQQPTYAPTVPAVQTPQPIPPLSDAGLQAPPTNASDIPSSPDIIRLANNNDLSISAIAREAHRLADDSEEVVVSLR